MSEHQLGGVAGMVRGETPRHVTGARHETPATPTRTIEPVTGWLCLNCGAMTEGVIDEPVPCCKEQFAMRAGFLHPEGAR